MYKNKNINKIKVVYEGVIILGVIFFIIASFLSMCLSGICADDWVVRNVAMSIVAEVVTFIWAIVHIKKGTVEILQTTRSYMAVNILYQRIRMLAGFGIAFGIIQIFVANGIFSGYGNHSHPLLVYGLNILGVSSFFFIWMCIAINKNMKNYRF